MNYKRITITSLVGSIGLAALSISLSFAWYNSSENLYIDTLVINVSGSRELRIATENSYDALTETLKFSFDDPESNLPGTDLFKPVSTMLKSKWMDEKASDPVFYEYDSALVDNLTRAPRERAAQWGYYSQHLYLYCNADTKVTLDASEENLFISPIRRMNEQRASYLASTDGVKEKYALEHPNYTQREIVEDLIKQLDNLTNCMRIAILDPDEESYQFTIIDPYKEEDTLLGGREDLFSTTYYDSYRNDVDGEYYEVIYGEVNDRNKAVYGEVSETDSEPPANYSSFAAKTKAGVHPFLLEESLNNGLEIKKEDSISRSEVEDKFYFNLKGGEIKEFVLAIYMEGWDVDCINSHMGGSFDMRLNFKIAEQTGQ